MATKTQETKTPPPMPPPAENNIPDRSAEAGLGFENFDFSKDQKIPFLQILQSQSPELERGHAKFIEGAERGDIINSATRKVYKCSEPHNFKITFIPCGYVRVHNEWNKRANGGGYVKTYLDNTQPETQEGMDKQKKVKELVNNTQHCLVETVMFGVYVMDAKEGKYEAIISMFGGSLGSSRDFTSKLKARKVNGKSVPMMDNVCELGTSLKKFNEGSAFIFTANIVGRTEEETYQEAKQIHSNSAQRLTLMAPAAAEQLTDREEEGEPSRTHNDGKY